MRVVVEAPHSSLPVAVLFLAWTYGGARALLAVVLLAVVSAASLACVGDDAGRQALDRGDEAWPDPFAEQPAIEPRPSSPETRPDAPPGPRCPCWPGGVSEVVAFHNIFANEPAVAFEECLFTSYLGRNHRVETRWVDWTDEWELPVPYLIRTDVDDAKGTCSKGTFTERPAEGAMATCVADLEKAAALLDCPR